MIQFRIYLAGLLLAGHLPGCRADTVVRGPAVGDTDTVAATDGPTNEDAASVADSAQADVFDTAPSNRPIEGDAVASDGGASADELSPDMDDQASDSVDVAPTNDASAEIVPTDAAVGDEVEDEKQSCLANQDCPGSLLCAKDSAKCVECLQDADCGPGLGCWQNECIVKIACASDLACVKAGLLCNKTLGLCVGCLQHTDCESKAHCASGPFAGGWCVADVCVQDSVACVNGSIVTCDAEGTGFLAAKKCPTETQCVQTPNGVACNPEN